MSRWEARYHRWYGLAQGFNIGALVVTLGLWCDLHGDTPQ